MMPLKVFVYIGHTKTGSTSLQRFLASNWLGLIRQGVLYPAVESRGVARNLATAVSGEEYGDLEGQLNVSEPHNALALRLKNEEDGRTLPRYYPYLPPGFQMLELIEQQVATLHPTKMVIVSEIFGILAGTAEQKGLERLARRIDRYDVTIICNLRRPDEHIASWDLQRLKFASPGKALRAGGTEDYLDTVHFDYAKMLAGWMKYFPKARFVVKNLSDVRKSGGTVAHMLREINPPAPELLKSVADQNPSLPRAFSMIGRRAMTEMSISAARVMIRAMVDARPDVPRPADVDVELFGRHARKLMQEGFEPIHDQLCKQTGQTPFFPDIDQISRVNPISDVDAAAQVWPRLKNWLLEYMQDDTALAWVQDYRV